jgi:hypothetical protein
MSRPSPLLLLLQALVLLLFNGADELTAESIKAQLGCDDDKELQRTLLSLSVGKVRSCLTGCIIFWR